MHILTYLFSQTCSQVYVPLDNFFHVTFHFKFSESVNVILIFAWGYKCSFAYKAQTSFISIIINKKIRAMEIFANMYRDIRIME